MDTDVRTVTMARAGSSPVIPLRPASAPPPNDASIRHWRDRARAAESRVEELEEVFSVTVEEMDRYIRDLAGIEDDVARCEQLCSDLQDENDLLRGDRWFRRTIVGTAAVLLGYAVGVLMR